jgi:chromate transporter
MHRKRGYVSAMAAHVPDSAPDAPTLSELFLAFLAVSLSGFGGTLPWAYRMVVEKRRWMTASEFSEVFSLCQFLPGANVVNFSVVFGSRLRGVPGALVCFIGLVGPPFGIVLVLGALYARFGDVEALGRILAGMAAAACGLIAATTAKLAEPLIRNRAVWPWGIVLAALMAVGVIGWPLPKVLLGLAPLSIALAWWERR